MNVIDELRDNELNSSAEIELFCRNLNSVTRDLYDAVYYGSEIMYANLSRIPGVGARVRAKALSMILRKAADGIHMAGTMAVKCHRTFVIKYSEELGKAKSPTKKKPFKF